MAGPEAVHKNSLEYVGDSHVYRISGPEGTYKIGESSQGIRARDGASIRGEKQARRLSRETGDYFVSEILRIFEDKSSARDYETRLIERLGDWGETRLRQFLDNKGYKPTQPLKTDHGNRYPDYVVDRIAHESKAGVNVQLTPTIKQQILKDRWLINNGRIDGAHWHFWQGAGKDVLDFLNQHDIPYTLH